jgi:hypothetical protein
MNIYKLQYNDKAQGDADLLFKGAWKVSEENEYVYTNGTQAIVYIGQIVEIPATYNGETELTPPIYYDGVFYDLMTTELYDFGVNEIFPKECVHSFLGYNTNADGHNVDPEAVEI